MNLDSRNKVLRETLLEEIATEIDMAREGQIPPSWQYDRLQDLKQAVERHWITEQEYSDLCARFEAAIHSTSQISDREYSGQVIAESGGNTLYCWCDKGNSTVTIERNENGYMVIVYLDEQALGETTRSCAEQCIRELEAYAAVHGFVPAPPTEQQRRAWCPPNCIATREAAFGYALAMLQSYVSVRKE